MERQKRMSELKRFNSDTSSRQLLGIWAASIVTLYLGAVIYLLIWNCYKDNCISDTVMVTLLGTTTLNVLGLMFIVLKGHFNVSNRN